MGLSESTLSDLRRTSHSLVMDLVSVQQILDPFDETWEPRRVDPLGRVTVPGSADALASAWTSWSSNDSALTTLLLDDDVMDAIDAANPYPAAIGIELHSSFTWGLHMFSWHVFEGLHPDIDLDGYFEWSGENAYIEDREAPPTEVLRRDVTPEQVEAAAPDHQEAWRSQFHDFIAANLLVQLDKEYDRIGRQLGLKGRSGKTVGRPRDPDVAARRERVLRLIKSGLGREAIADRVRITVQTYDDDRKWLKAAGKLD